MNDIWYLKLFLNDRQSFMLDYVTYPPISYTVDCGVILSSHSLISILPYCNFLLVIKGYFINSGANLSIKFPQPNKSINSKQKDDSGHEIIQLPQHPFCYDSIFWIISKYICGNLIILMILIFQPDTLLLDPGGGREERKETNRTKTKMNLLTEVGQVR